MDKERKDPETIDLGAPRIAQYLHNAWKKTSEYGVLGRHQSCSEERIEVLSNTIERDNSSRSTSSLFAFRKLSGWNLEKTYTYERQYLSPRPPPKISLKHDWKRECDSEHAQRTEGQVAQQSRSFQSNQPIPNSGRDRTGQPVVGTNTRTVQDGRKTSRSQEIDTCSFHEEAVKTDRTGQPVLQSIGRGTRPVRRNNECARVWHISRTLARHVDHAGPWPFWLMSRCFVRSTTLNCSSLNVFAEMFMPAKSGCQKVSRDLLIHALDDDGYRVILKCDVVGKLVSAFRGKMMAIEVT